MLIWLSEATLGLTGNSVIFTLKITLRAAPVGSSMRPLPEQRFVEGSRVFRIQAVTERGNDLRYLTCFADEELVA